MGMSKAEMIAELSAEEQQAIFGDMSDEELLYLQYDPEFWLRPEQMIKDGDWFITAVVSGRGWGKTRCASEWIRRKALENPGCRIAVAGKTAADVRETMVEGESGILAVHHPLERPEYKPSIRRIEWANGSQASLIAAESPDQARGPQYHYAVGDEFAAWKEARDTSGATLFSNMIAATRLGDRPQILLTTTPKRTATMKKIMDDADDPAKKTFLIRGTTFDNKTLSANYVETVVGQYGNTDLAKQELMGDMLTDAEGLVFTEELITASRLYAANPPRTAMRIVAVDPTVAAEPRDECGIVVVGTNAVRNKFERQAIVLEDASLKAAPTVWAQRVVDMCTKWNTKFVVIEKNQGQDLLKNVILQLDDSLQIFLVNAAAGKKIRAEPVVMAMQQKRVKIWNSFPELEDQMLFFDPDSSSSPDRMDAYVWGVTALLIDPPKGLRLPTMKINRPVGSVQLTNRNVGIRNPKLNGR